MHCTFYCTACRVLHALTRPPLLTDRDTFFANKDPATGKRLKSFVPVETWKTTGKPKPEGDPNDPGQLLPSSGNGLMKSDAEAVNALYKPPTEAPPVSVANPTTAKW